MTTIDWFLANGAAKFATLIQQVPSLLALSQRSLIILAPDDAAIDRLQARIGKPLAEIIEIPKVLEIFLNHFSIHPWQQVPPMFRAVSGFGVGSSAQDFQQLQVRQTSKIGNIDVAVIGVLMINNDQLAEVTKVNGLLNYLENLPYNVFINLVEMGDIKGKDLVHLCSTSTKLKAQCDKSFEQRSREGRVLGSTPQYVYVRLLEREFGVRQLLPGKDARQTYIWYSRGGGLCQSVLQKFRRWKEMDPEGPGRMYYPTTIYDMLYQDDSNGYTIGSHVINDTTYIGGRLGYHPHTVAVRPRAIDELRNLSQNYFFYGMFEDIEAADQMVTGSPYEMLLEHTPGIRYDYDLMKRVYYKIDDDLKFKEAFERTTGYPVTILSTYPLLYSAKLKENPAMVNRDFLREAIRKRTDSLMHYLNEDDYDETVPFKPAVAAVRLTDAEIEFILDLHFRVLDPADPLKINTLATCEDIVQ